MVVQLLSKGAVSEVLLQRQYHMWTQVASKSEASYNRSLVGYADRLAHRSNAVDRRVHQKWVLMKIALAYARSRAL
jgi:hypothetical protein